jgi:predicted  nucleic acid-binding Zn-ribbon protein
MMVSITLLLIAVSNAITAYYGARRSDKLQEEVDVLESRISNLNNWAIKFEYETKGTINNVDKQIKSQYSHFTSRIDKTRNDVLQNNKTY